MRHEPEPLWSRDERLNAARSRPPATPACGQKCALTFSRAQICVARLAYRASDQRREMGMFERRARRGVIFFSAGAAMLCSAAGSGLATTHEQIVEACREAARPTVVACMQGKRGQGDHDAALEQCRQAVGVPFVKACVLREEQKEAAGKTAPAAPVAAAAPPPSGAFSVQPTFVAPPRTTADISAILDREKPDAEKISARKAEADAVPPRQRSARRPRPVLFRSRRRQSDIRSQPGRPRRRPASPRRGKEHRRL